MWYHPLRIGARAALENGVHGEERVFAVTSLHYPLIESCTVTGVRSACGLPLFLRFEAVGSLERISLCLSSLLVEG